MSRVGCWLASLAIALGWQSAGAEVPLAGLGVACGIGREDACAQLQAMARASRDGLQRRKAAETLVKARSRGCPPGASLAGWSGSPRVRMVSEYFFEQPLDAGREAQIVQAGEQFQAGVLRSLGFTVTQDADSADATVRFTLLGSAQAWLFTPRDAADPYGSERYGLSVVLFADAAWQGAITVRAAGRCLSEPVRPGPPNHENYYGPQRRKLSEAPFRRDLQHALAPALLRLGKDLQGSAAIARLARYDGAVLMREIALAQLRDQGVLAEIARRDGEQHLRWVAARKVTSQDVLREVARDDPDPFVRLAAVERLDDAAFLAGIAQSDRVPEVRRQAASRVERLGKTR